MQKSFLKHETVNNLNETSHKDNSASMRSYPFDEDSQTINREYYDSDGILICKEEVHFWRRTSK